MALPQPRQNGGEASDNRKESARRNIQELLTDSKMQTVFASLLPKHFTPERMVRLSIMAVTRTPKLAEVHPMLLLGAFVECAALGLEPNSPLDHVHLLPFWNSKINAHEITRIIGYRGYIELARRTGEQVSVHADVAYERDKFEVSYGTECYLRHTPLFGEQDRGKPIGAYCHVALRDGQAFYAMPWSEVLKARDRSPSVRQKRSSPWDTDLDRMARKTPIRRLYGGGEVPMSIELAQAIALDERSMDYRALAKASVDDVAKALDVKEALESFALPEPEDDSGPQGGGEQTPQQHQGSSRTPEIRTEQSSQQNEPAGEWTIDNKVYKQPGRVQNILIGKIGACTEIDDLKPFDGDEFNAFLETLPPTNRQAIEQAVAHQRSVIEAVDERPQIPSTTPGRPTEDHPMASVDHLEDESFRKAGEQKGGKAQFNLLGQ